MSDYPEHGSSTFPSNVGDYQLAQRHIPENSVFRLYVSLQYNLLLPPVYFL